MPILPLFLVKVKHFLSPSCVFRYMMEQAIVNLSCMKLVAATFCYRVKTVTTTLLASNALPTVPKSTLGRRTV